MKTSILLVLTAWLLSFQAAAQSLDYFVELAQKNHPLILSKTAETKAEKMKADQISVLMDPELSFGYNVLHGGMEKYSAGLMQGFSWFGTARHQKAAAKAGTESLVYELETVKKQVEIEISLLYYELQKTTEILSLLQETTDVFQTLEEITTNNLETSGSAMTDVLRVQLQKEDIMNELNKLRQKKESQVYTLNRLTGRQDNEPVETEFTEYHPPAVAVAATMHPEIEAVNAKISQSAELQQVVRKQSMPQLGAGVEYMAMKPSGSQLMPMLSISIPINRKKYRAGEQEMAGRTTALNFEKEWIENQLDREKFNLITETGMAETERKSIRKQLQKIQDIYQLSLDYYTASGKEFKNVLELKNEELKRRIQLAENHARLLALAKQLEYFNY